MSIARSEILRYGFKVATTQGLQFLTSDHRMDMPGITVRPACSDDARNLQRLRNYYIEHGHATFDEEPLGTIAIQEWMRSFSETGPYRLLVAEVGGELAGFCSSQPYRSHPAFRFTAETSIYVASRHAGRGVGSALYERLFSILAGEEVHRVVAGVALPNDGSIALHRRFGFGVVGTFSEYAVKNGRFVSSTWLEKRIAG